MTNLPLQHILIFFILFIVFIILINSLHPIYFITLLLLYSITICLIISIWKFTYIYSIIIFIIIIRGLLIIFIYFARLISNEQNKLKLNTLLILNILLNSTFFLWFISSLPQSNLIPRPYTPLETIPTFKINSFPFQNIIEIYNYPYLNLTLMRIFFLLISLFLIIKIISIKTSSLRKIQ